MSRIGKKLILIPQGVEAEIKNGEMKIRGPKGELSRKIHPHVNIEKKDNQILITVKNPELKKDKAIWGLYGSSIKNMIAGVVKGFEKKLEIIGVGYKASLAGNKLVLNIGFSHPVEFELPKNISVNIDKNIITVVGTDKQLVGEIAARVRAVKPPEPYKGTGIKYVDELIRKKAGKAAKATGTKT
jgi:large subunit ribosomal protein L6